MRRIYLYTLLLLCLGVSMEASEYALPQVYISFEGDAKKVLKSDMDYVFGEVRIVEEGAQEVVLPAKFKTRGATAAKYKMKPSLNMKLRTETGEEVDSCLLGIRSCSAWILDAMAIDRIEMRNRVAMDIWNAMSPLPYETKFGGRSGTQGRFVEVYINEAYYGIYCFSDKINRKLLALKKFNEETQTVRGVLYKSGTDEIENQNDPGYNDDYTACVVEWHNAWELKYPEDYASPELWAPLQDVYVQGREYEYVKQKFNLGNLVDYQLLIMALSVQDNWGNKNKYASVRDITADDDKATMLITPWDLDCALGGKYDGGYYNGTYSDWSPYDIGKVAVRPFSSCQGQMEYKRMLYSRWKEEREGPLSLESVSGSLRSYTELFIQSGAWQRQWDYYQAQSSHPCLVEDLAAEVEMVIDWYADRIRQMDEYFADVVGLDECSQEKANGGYYKTLVNGQICIHTPYGDYSILGTDY